MTEPALIKQNWNEALEDSPLSFRKAGDSRVHGLSSFFPRHDESRCLKSGWEWGLLLDWTGKCPHDSTHSEVFITKNETQFAGCQWRCSDCSKSWSVFKGSDFSNSKIEMWRQVYIKYETTQPGLSNDCIATKYAVSPNYVGEVYSKMRSIGTKWNILHPPDIHGECQFDEARVSARKAANRKKGRPQHNATMWALALVSKTTGQVQMGCSQVRNSQVIHAFVTSSLNRYFRNQIDTDSWSGTICANLGEIPLFLNTVRNVNHKKTYKDILTGACSNYVERLFRTMRFWCIRSLNGIPAANVASYCQWFQFMWNSTNSLKNMKFSQVFLSFCSASKEVNEFEQFDHPIVIPNPTMPLIANVDSEVSVTGVSETTIKNLIPRRTTRSGDVVENKRGWNNVCEVVNSDKIKNVTITPEGGISAEVMSGSESLVHQVHIHFTDLTKTTDLLDPDNITTECSCQHCASCCKHSLSVLTKFIAKSESRSWSQHLGHDNERAEILCQKMKTVFRVVGKIRFAGVTWCLLQRTNKKFGDTLLKVEENELNERDQSNLKASDLYDSVVDTLKFRGFFASYYY